MESTRAQRREAELLKVGEQATEWLNALDAAGVEERAAFADWIQESRLHVDMFLRVSALSQMGELYTPAERRRLVDRVLAQPPSLAPSPACTAWPAVPRSPVPPPPVARTTSDASGSLSTSARRWRARRWAAALAALAAALATAAVGLWLFAAGPLSWTAYATAIGEQRTLQLADGSVVYMNADSRLQVRLSEHQRQVTLQRGEALFQVAHDRARPFLVRVNQALVRAVGTQFDVYRHASGATVAVVEGVVEISQLHAASLPPASSAARSAHEQLTAGQQVVLPANGQFAPPAAANVAQVTAWRQRRLIFEWDTLETIAQQFNRYNRRPQIRIEGDGIRARRYTAVFDADDPQALLKFLAEDGGLRFAAEGDTLVIRGR